MAVYATDAAGTITYFNQTAAAFVGERPDLHGDHWLSWPLFGLDGSVLPRAEFPTAVTLRERRPVRKQIIAERPNGTRITFTVHSAPVFDDSGQINGTVNGLVAEQADCEIAEPSPEGRTQIISDMADSLQTSERSFRTLVESVIDYAIFMLDSLVHNLVEMLRRTLGERVKVKTVLGFDTGLVEADPAELENALLNLVGVNSRDAMPEGGALSRSKLQS